jgi:hypothetical protein
MVVAGWVSPPTGAGDRGASGAAPALSAAFVRAPPASAMDAAAGRF